MAKQYNLSKIEFTTGELRSLPPVHASYFVSSCLAINEINVILKVFLMALNTRAAHSPTSERPLQEIAYAQAVIIQRNLGAKVFEYLKMTKAYKKICERAGDTAMKDFLDEVESVRVCPVTL